MELLNVDTIDTAIEKLCRVTAGHLPRRIRLPLLEADGAVLAKAACAKEDVPGFDRSTVDGYAVHAADTAGAGESLPCFLHLLGAVEMGRKADFTISPGQCVYVPTGGMLPQGADAVVMVEYCERFGDRVAVSDPVSPGRNVVWQGEDVKGGQRVLAAGKKLRPADIGALAALGLAEVEVWQAPRLLILSTGDELVPPETPTLQPGQIRDINSYALAALARKLGFYVDEVRLIADREELFRETLQNAMGQHDLVVVSGGSSQGLKDMTERLFNEVASPGVLTHGLAVKPGKPTILAWNEASETLFLGLPGHPVSALTVFEGVAGGWWRQMTGAEAPAPLPARLTCNLMGAAGKQTFQPVRLERDNEGYLATPVFYRSGLISALAGADGYLVLDRDQEGLAAGEQVMIYLY